MADKQKKTGSGTRSAPPPGTPGSDQPRDPHAGTVDEPLPGGDVDEKGEPTGEESPKEKPPEIPQDADGNVKAAEPEPENVNDLELRDARAQVAQGNRALGELDKEIERLQEERARVAQKVSEVSLRVEQLTPQETDNDRIKRAIDSRRRARAERRGRRVESGRAPIDEAFRPRRGFGLKRPNVPLAGQPATTDTK